MEITNTDKRAINKAIRDKYPEARGIRWTPDEVSCVVDSPAYNRGSAGRIYIGDPNELIKSYYIWGKPLIEG